MCKDKKHWNTENPNAVPLRTYLNPAGFWSALYSAIKLELRLACMEKLIDLKRSGACCKLENQEH